MVNMRVFATTVTALILVSAFSGYYIHTLTGRIADLESQLSDWMRKYSQLDANYRELAERYSALNDQYNQLKVEHTDLQFRYERLSEDYKTLKSQYESLQSSYTQLQSQYQSLLSEYNDLTNRYTALNRSYTLLLNGYESLKLSYDQLHNKYNYFISWYNNLRNQVNTRIVPYLNNLTMFITPDDPLVVSLMYNVTGGWSNTSDWFEYWFDVYLLYKWVVDNIKYSHDSPEPVLPDVGETVFWRNSFWRFPNETIRDGTGDCEDMANLLASLILAYGGKRYKVWVMIVDFGGTGHAAVVLPVKGGEIAILDPAGKYYTSTSFGLLTARDVAEELQNYFRYWASAGYPNGRVYAIYSYNMYRTFNSNEEFIQYVKSITAS